MTAVLLATPLAGAQEAKGKPAIPHNQTQPPGPPLSPKEAIAKMKLPEGFHVQLVAAEPDIVNPVAMAIDDKGRFWITESLEYPRKAPGPGRDRVKVLESTKGDGVFDKITTVIDGLNIPSGIAVGHGGVWLANAPDILFYPFEDWDAPKLGKPHVVVTGFGRADTHELPNSLTWGPDGYLYGLNGVFNPSVVKQNGKEFRFTCAMFRIHPRTKEFSLFCEGTSNPWGIAFNENGDAFVSACVIDHLWHLTETGYYHRQGGPYPPWTWKIGSITKHKHQKAAYCGLTWFDSDAYPPEYRGKLYMGNIHGNCINSDELTRDGSTYLAKIRPDFLTANDVWFMPVVQKTGPDGCLYILDWYDRYHCYQDANRDPAGIDRLRGRLYRVVYKDYKPAGRFDLTKETHQELIDRLGSSNVYLREIAQRNLEERLGDADSASIRVQEVVAAIADLARDGSHRTTRLHALRTLLNIKNYVPGSYLKDADPTVRAWEVRALGNRGKTAMNTGIDLAALASDPAPEVQLQVAIAARKLADHDALPLLTEVLGRAGDDALIPHIVWQNLQPQLEKDGERFLHLASKVDLAKAPGMAKLLPRAIDRILGNASGDPAAVVSFVEKLAAQNKDQTTAALCVTGLTSRVLNNEMSEKHVAALRQEFGPKLLVLHAGASGPLAVEATFLLAALKESAGMQRAAHLVRDTKEIPAVRVRALETLIRMGEHGSVVDSVEEILRTRQGSPEFRGQVLGVLAVKPASPFERLVLRHYNEMEPELQPKAIDMLTQNAAWAKALFWEIADRRIDKHAVNVNQARRLLAAKDPELTKLVEQHWGTPREGRNPEREKIVAEMRSLILQSKGDPIRGLAVFKKVCAQCHKLHGEGTDVGPDITGNGRSDFDQLLSNVFDPSLVIGSGYQATMVSTTKGQILTGLVVEDNEQRIVLKTQGGKLDVIPRGDVEEVLRARLSLMPEGLEKQLHPQEVADLFALLVLDRHPSDPAAKKIPGSPK
jgi:putative membrane-bound dehydrogenase-like protein